MRAARTVLYHSAILSNWPVRKTKWANLAGLTGCVAGLRWRIGATSFIAESSLCADRLAHSLHRAGHHRETAS